jgi:hypothetical protein
MEKELKELLEESKRSLEKAEKKIDAYSKDFNKETLAFWNELKVYFSEIKESLSESFNEMEGSAELKANLGMMEAKEKLAYIQDSVEKFLYRASKDTEKELDIAALKAHLAKKDSEDLWNEKRKELSRLYASSKIEVDKLTKKAGQDFNDIVVKLTDLA